MDETVSLLEGLAKSGRLLRNVTSSAELYQTVFKNLREFVKHDRAAIWLNDSSEESLSIVASEGWDEEERAGAKVFSGQGFAGRALELGETQVVQETIESESDGSPRRAAAEVAIPLKDGVDVLGVLTVKRFEEKFDEGSCRFFAVFGEQLASAIGRLKLKGALEQRARKLVWVSRAGQAITAGDSFDTAIEKVLTLADSALGSDGCSVQLVDGDGEQLLVVAARGRSQASQGTRVPAGQGIRGIATQTQRPSLIPDTSKAAHQAMAADEFLSEIAVPLKFKGAVVGVLHFGHERANRFDETDLLHATVFADQMAALVGCDRLIEELYLRDMQIRYLTRALDQVAGEGDLNAALDEIFDLTRGILAPGCAAVLVPEEGGTTLRTLWAFEMPDRVRQTTVPVDGSIPGEAYRIAAAVVIPDVERDPRYVPICANTRSEAALPIRVGGRVAGVLLVDSLIELDEERMKTARYLAVQIAMLMNR